MEGYIYEIVGEGPNYVNKILLPVITRKNV